MDSTYSDPAVREAIRQHVADTSLTPVEAAAADIDPREVRTARGDVCTWCETALDEHDCDLPDDDLEGID